MRVLVERPPGTAQIGPTLVEGRADKLRGPSAEQEPTRSVMARAGGFMSSTGKQYRDVQGALSPGLCALPIVPEGGTQELVFEIAHVGELAEILAIETSSFPAPWSWQLFVQEIESTTSRILVARAALEEGRPIVGYVCWSFVAGEMHLLNLAVHPERRRCGVGRRLLRMVIDDARVRRAEAVYLEVREANRGAACLYRLAGFVRVGSRRHYYGPGEHAVVMALRLTVGDD